MSGDVKVEVRRVGRRFEADATLELAADPQTVWNTRPSCKQSPRRSPAAAADRNRHGSLHRSGIA